LSLPFQFLFQFLCGWISYVFLGFVLQPFYFGNKVTCFSCAKRWIATQTLEKHRASAKGLGTGIGRELGWTNETGKTQGVPLPWTQGNALRILQKVSHQGKGIMGWETDRLH